MCIRVILLFIAEAYQTSYFLLVTGSNNWWQARPIWLTSGRLCWFRTTADEGRWQSLAWSFHLQAQHQGTLMGEKSWVKRVLGVTKGVIQAKEQMEPAMAGRWNATLYKQRPCDLEGPFAPLSLNFLNYQTGTQPATSWSRAGAM